MYTICTLLSREYIRIAIRKTGKIRKLHRVNDFMTRDEVKTIKKKTSVLHASYAFTF